MREKEASQEGMGINTNYGKNEESERLIAKGSINGKERSERNNGNDPK